MNSTVLGGVFERFMSSQRAPLGGVMNKASILLAASAPCWAALPASAQDITPPDILTVSPTGVNLSDGSFNFSQVDMKIGSLSLERFATGGPIQDVDVMPFGYHSGNNFDIFFREHQITGPRPNPIRYYRAIIHIGNSASSTYDIAHNVTPTFIAPNTDNAYEGVLELSGSAYVYTDQAGTVYTFNPSVPVNGAGGQTQRVVSVVYANGRVLNFSYNSSLQLKLVTSSDGYAIVFDYTGLIVSSACGFNLSRNYVSSATACVGATLKTSYSYTNGVLTSSIDPLGAVTSYSYTSASADSATHSAQSLKCILPPGYSACRVNNTYTINGNGSSLRVSQQTMADGSIWQFDGGNANLRDPDYEEEDGDNYASMIDPANVTSAFSFTKSSPYTFTDASGRISEYRFGGGSQYYSTEPVTSQGKLLFNAKLPDGNEYVANYDPSHFNLPAIRTWKAKPGSGLADLVETFTYPSCDAPNTRQNCVHAITKVDARNNTTDYVYTSYGSIQSEMRSAPVSGAARPLKLYTYAQKYAYILNSGSALVAAASPIWMPMTETVCQTAAGSSTAACDGAAPRMVTTYEYGADGTADNLLVRGVVVTDLSTGTSLRTCYSYDDRSRRISETKPRAGLSSCP